MKYHTFRTRHVQATYALMSCKNNNECNLSVEKPFHVRSIPCSFFRLKESFQVKNGVTTSFLFFFLKMPKIWVGWMTVNGEKKEDGLCR